MCNDAHRIHIHGEFEIEFYLESTLIKWHNVCMCNEPERKETLYLPLTGNNFNKLVLN